MKLRPPNPVHCRRGEAAGAQGSRNADLLSRLRSERQATAPLHNTIQADLLPYWDGRLTSIAGCWQDGQLARPGASKPVRYEAEEAHRPGVGEAAALGIPFDSRPIRDLTQGVGEGAAQGSALCNDRPRCIRKGLADTATTSMTRFWRRGGQRGRQRQAC